MSLAVVDLGVGIADVAGPPFVVSGLETVVASGVVEGGGRGEEKEVSVERGEGVDGSIVGEGGRRTRATTSSSRSASVIIEVVPMAVECARLIVLMRVANEERGSRLPPAKVVKSLRDREESEDVEELSEVGPTKKLI